MAASSELEQEANDRLKLAKRQKDYRVAEYRECYFFACPNRQRVLTSGAAPAMGPVLDAAELNTDLASILVDDFVTELFNTFMPPEQKWCERGPGIGIPQEAFNSVKDQVALDDEVIFKAMKASNLYAVIPMAATPDLAIAGCGLWIDQSRAYEPIKVMAVPMREIEVNLGPDGEIDDKFVVRYVRNCYVRSVLGKELAAKLPAGVAAELDKKGDKSTEVTWGYWRLWDRDDDIVYQYTVLVGDKLIHQDVLVGEGSCPFVFMRFKATADWPWAVGPMMQGLPTLRQYDEWERQIPEAVERYSNSPITFPDDSFTQVEQGLEPGMAYSIRTGSEGAVKRIYDQPPIDPELRDLERKEHRLRKIFYIDHPEQSGDTPPTLGQWLDELARAQRRIGTPGQPFWREGPRAIFLRFKYLLTKSEAIQKLEDKEGRAIATLPYNPAQRAAEQQEIATAFQCAQALSQMFPEEWRVAIDGTGSMEAIITKMRTAGLLKMRKPEDIKAALAQIQQLLGQGGLRQHAGAPVPEGAGAPAAAAA